MRGGAADKNGCAGAKQPASVNVFKKKTPQRSVFWRDSVVVGSQVPRPKKKRGETLLFLNPNLGTEIRVRHGVLLLGGVDGSAGRGDAAA